MSKPPVPVPFVESYEEMEGFERGFEACEEAVAQLLEQDGAEPPRTGMGVHRDRMSPSTSAKLREWANAIRAGKAREVKP